MNLLSTIAVFVTVTYFSDGVYIPPGPRYRCPEKVQNIHPCKCVKESDVGINIICENTNLASISIALNNLAAHNAPIEELTFYKCHIEKLYGNLFYKTEARILKIIDTPIEKIDEHTFYGINNTLNEFHLLNSNLNEFPKLAFKVMGNLTVLIIDGHRIVTLDKDIFGGSLAAGKLDKLILVNGNLSELQFESFQPLRKLKSLDLHGNNLTVLKRNQFKDLRDVEVLDISYNKITKLDSSHISDLTKLGWCNVSNNALAELTRGTFARNAVLKLLNMSNNKIKRLDSNSFRGMRFLRRLFLSDNEISDVARGTFTSITRIGTIDLARNFLTKVDFQMFAQLNYVEIIDVSSNNVTEIQKQAFKDLYLTKIYLSNNSISKIEPNSFENCANITLLDLSHNQIQVIPKKAFDHHTYALEIQISYNLLTNFSMIPLQNMTGLKILNASHNLITEIPKNTFPKLYELHTIDASYNNISEISNAVFQPLFSLRSLNLSYNSLEIIKPPMFGTLPTLLEMDLSNNKLKSIAKGAFTKLASLRMLTLENNMLEDIFTISISLNHLNLKNNWLTEIPEKTWPSMNALLTLDLSGNRLSDNLKSGSFTGLLTLQKVNLNSNGITKVPWESFAPLSTLQYIYLENNNLTELRKGSFGKLPVVFEINMYNNQIFNVSVKAFDGLLQLLKLNLSSNALKTIPNEAFYGLVSLRELDLSRNMLDKIDNKTHGLLDDCLSLQKIDLSHNRISFVGRKTFPSNPYIPYRLQEIDLSYNIMPVLTYDITFGTKKTTYLNLSHNNINDFRRYVLGNLTSIQTLDLSFNELRDLTVENFTFDLPENITNLYLQNNKLFRIPVDKIVNATNLRVLDIRNNELDNIDRKIIERITQNLDVYFDGNSLNCNCTLRPLKHYLQTLTTSPEFYNVLKCETPTYVNGVSLIEADDDFLTCPLNVNTTKLLENEDYEALPDLRFRHIAYSRGKLIAQWYVTSTRDIADFYVNIRDAQNNVLFEEVLGYDKRDIQIKKENVPNVNGDNYLQICVLAKSSNGNLNGWFKKQCQNLPMNLDGMKKMYHESYYYSYTILSTDKRIKVSTEFSSSNGHKLIYHLSIITILSMIIFYL